MASRGIVDRGQYLKGCDRTGTPAPQNTADIKQHIAHPQQTLSLPQLPCQAPNPVPWGSSIYLYPPYILSSLVLLSSHGSIRPATCHLFKSSLQRVRSLLPEKRARVPSTPCLTRRPLAGSPAPPSRASCLVSQAYGSSMCLPELFLLRLVISQLWSPAPGSK